MRNLFLIAAAASLALVAQASFGGSLIAPVGGVSSGNAAGYQNHADPLLMDRGLPTTGVYAGGTNPNWGQRTNIGTGDYDAQDPIWVNDNYGPPELAGDTFSLSQTAYVTDIRLWLDPNNGASSYAAAFQSMSLMLGSYTTSPTFSWQYQPSGWWNLPQTNANWNSNGPVGSSSMSLLPGAPTETNVTFPGTRLIPTLACPICCGNWTSRSTRP